MTPRQRLKLALSLREKAPSVGPDLSDYRHKPARRKCLGCQKPFDSQHAGNRLCAPCNRFAGKAAAIAEHVIA